MMGHSATDLSDLLGPEAEEPSSIGIPATMGEADLATFLGISSSRLRTLARDGVVVRSSRGRYDVRASLSRYLDQLRTHAARAGRPTEAAGDDYKAERTRLAREQADASALKNAALRGEMVAASDVQREWAGILRDTRNALLAVPSRCGGALPHLTAHDVAMIGREIGAALEGLANG